MSGEFQGLTSPRLIRILAFVQRGSHSLISSSNVTTRDQPWADHPETACDYTINELFNSHYFIVIRNERTWFRGEIKRAWGCPQEETCCREETDDWGSTTPLLSLTRAVYLLREETGYLIYSHTHRERCSQRERRGETTHTLIQQPLMDKWMHQSTGKTLPLRVSEDGLMLSDISFPSSVAQKSSQEQTLHTRLKNSGDWWWGSFPARKISEKPFQANTEHY